MLSSLSCSWCSKLIEKNDPFISEGLSIGDDEVMIRFHAKCVGAFSSKISAMASAAKGSIAHNEGYYETIKEIVEQEKAA